MPWLASKSRRIHYELTGPDDGPACVLVNGLTQYVKLWMPFRDGLVARGFRVASYDMLGQGQSDKPRLFIDQTDQVDVLRELIAALGPQPVFVGGISFGGVIALRYAIEYPDTIAGLVPMSSFAEIPPQLMRLGTAMRTALILGGTTYLQDLLFPMNFSNAWLEAKADIIDLATHRGWLINDVYALQNLMELFLSFEPLTATIVVDPRADHDHDRRVRFPHAAAAAGFAAHAYSRQRVGHHSARLSCLHAGARGSGRLRDGAVRRGRDGRPLSRARSRSGSRRKKSAANSSPFPPASIICARSRCA